MEYNVCAGFSRGTQKRSLAMEKKVDFRKDWLLRWFAKANCVFEASGLLNNRSCD